MEYKFAPTLIYYSKIELVVCHDVSNDTPYEGQAAASTQ